MKISVISYVVSFGLALAVQAAQPNILLILADDLGYADVGFNKRAKDIKTPNLDRLAMYGTICTAAYAGHSFGGPSRAALMTGRYPQTIGSHFNLPARELDAYREQGISPDYTLISTVLQNAGYFTGLVGKWPLGEQEDHHPNNRGFDEFWGFLGEGKNYFGPYLEQTGTVGSYKTYPEYNSEPVTHLTEKDYLTDVMTEQGVRFIKYAAAGKDPFFLMMSYSAPHAPLQAKADDLALFEDIEDEKRRTYAAMVYAMDRGVGRLIDMLNKTRQYEKTLIVFLSDNGGNPDEGADNTPFKKGKNSSCEGGIRVPMFWHWKGHMPGGWEYDYVISSLDLYPTLAALAKASIPEAAELAGKNVFQSIADGTEARKGDMIYTVRYDDENCEVGARRDEWKIYRSGFNPWELYNLSEDPGETKDLRAEYPERLQELVKEARKMTRSHVEPHWFNTQQSERRWHEKKMPRYRETFTVQ